MVQVSSYSPAQSLVWMLMSAVQHQELRANRFVRTQLALSSVCATLASTSSLITKAANQKVLDGINRLNCTIILNALIFLSVIYQECTDLLKS